MSKWIMGIMVAGLGLGLAVGPAVAQQAGSPPAAITPTQKGNLPTPLETVRGIQEIGQTLFKLADSNNDGEISQKEAIDVANLVVGGLFFRADTNGDGVISPEEARAARDQLFQKRPWLRFVIERSQGAQGAGGQIANAPQNPFRNLGSLLDSNQDRNLQATEVRQAVQSTVQTLFTAADTDHNGQLSPREVNAAVAGLARTAGQVAFQAADTNHDGQISQDEFLRMLAAPARSMFAILDANGDGQLSQQELQSAQRVIASELRALRVMEQANSPARLIESGHWPEEVAPVPNIPVPAPAPTQPPTATPTTIIAPR